MKNYELTYLISPGLSEEERKDLCQKVISDIGVQPETKQETSSWTSFNFLVEPEKIKDIGEKMKNEPSIRRYMIVIKKIIKPEVLLRKRRRAIKEELIEKPKTRTEKPKVELKEIEEKLNEILKE